MIQPLNNYDIVYKVLTYLPLSDFKSSNVCVINKTFNDICNNHKFWNYIFKRDNIPFYLGGYILETPKENIFEFYFKLYDNNINAINNMSDLKNRFNVQNNDSSYDEYVIMHDIINSINKLNKSIIGKNLKYQNIININDDFINNTFYEIISGVEIDATISIYRENDIWKIELSHEYFDDYAYPTIKHWFLNDNEIDILLLNLFTIQVPFYNINTYNVCCDKYL